METGVDRSRRWWRWWWWWRDVRGGSCFSLSFQLFIVGTVADAFFFFFYDYLFFPGFGGLLTWEWVLQDLSRIFIYNFFPMVVRLFHAPPWSTLEFSMPISWFFFIRKKITFSKSCIDSLFFFFSFVWMTTHWLGWNLKKMSKIEWFFRFCF